MSLDISPLLNAIARLQEGWQRYQLDISEVQFMAAQSSHMVNAASTWAARPGSFFPPAPAACLSTSHEWRFGACGTATYTQSAPACLQ